MRRFCPHPDIRHCPLYEAMHIAGLPSCIHDRLEEGCAVAVGLAKYADLVGALIAKAPEIVARNRWNEEAEQLRAQKSRNLRTNGIH